MDSLDFIKQVASGNSGDAKETLSNLIANAASEALEDKKVSIASSIYNSPVEEAISVDSEPDMKVRSLYAKKYIQNFTRGMRPSEAVNSAYRDIESSHGKKITDNLKSYHKSNWNEEVELFELAGYSAKAGAAGKDLGKPGKNFKKIEDKAAKEYGSKEAGARVAGAVLNKLRHEEVMHEHVEGDEKELTKGMRLIHKNEPEGSPHTSKVYHNRDWNEWQTHFYKKGRHMGEGPIGYHDNKEDAIEHAGYGVKHFNNGGI